MRYIFICYAVFVCFLGIASEWLLREFTAWKIGKGSGDRRAFIRYDPNELHWAMRRWKVEFPKNSVRVISFKMHKERARYRLHL